MSPGQGMVTLMATDATTTHLHRRSVRPGPWARLTRAELGLTSALLFLGCLLVYCLTPTHRSTFDAVSYANQIAHLYPRTGDAHWLFHPHHLLFNAVGYVLWRAARVLGYVGGPLPVLQSLNAVLGAAGAVLLYRILRGLMRRSHWLPFLLSLGLALTFGYWVCATDGRVNMASTTLLIAAFAVTCRLLVEPRPRLAALVGALAGAAVLFHESAGLFLPVGVAGVLLAGQESLLLPQARRQRRRDLLLAYFVTWVGVVAIPYLLVGSVALGLRSPGGFHRWMSTYSELGWWWDFHIVQNLRADASALYHALFAEPPDGLGPWHALISGPLTLRLLYGGTLAGLLMGTYTLFAALPLLWRSPQRGVLVVCLLWMGLYAAFFTVWSPGYFVFWVPVLVPAGVLLALALAHYRARYGVMVNWLLGIWVLLYAALNLVASIGPSGRTDASPFERVARDVRAHTQPGDLVLVSGVGNMAQCEVDIPYFADRDVLSLHGLLTHWHEDKAQTLDDAQSQIARTLASGRAVYALDEMAAPRWPRTLSDLHRNHKHPEWGTSEMQTLFAPYQRSLAWAGPRGKVWRLTPTPSTL